MGIVNERQISFANESVKNVNAENIICVVYTTFDETLFFDVTGLNESEIEDLIHKLIHNLTFGTNMSREIIHKSGNIYFVY